MGLKGSNFGMHEDVPDRTNGLKANDGEKNYFTKQ